MAEVAYQNAAQVRQLLAERENAEAYGQETRLGAIDKQLAGLGYTEPEKAPKKVADAPQGRKAPAKATAEAATETPRKSDTK
jgi:hypothetical protein